MKLFTHIDTRLLAISLLAGILVPLPASAQPSPQPPVPTPKTNQETAVLVQSVRVIAAYNGPAIEIISTRPLVPTLGKLENPSRLVVDLPGASVSLRKRIPVTSDEVSALRVDQYRDAPPVARIVVDLLQPVSYTWDAAGNRLMVRLHSMLPAKANPATVPAVVPVIQPAAPRSENQLGGIQSVGVQPAGASTNGASAGAILIAGARVAGGSSVTAGADTATLNLARGGQVRVCTGTTVSVTTSQNGHDVMLGMSTGALEAHYKLEASADSVLTPDFRILLAGPGEFHYAISADSRGNTCVRALPGNTASVIVSELMGNGTYQVKPNEQVVFRAGRLTTVDAAIPSDCGCPAAAVPVMRTSGPPAPLASPSSELTRPAIPLPGVSSSEPSKTPPAQVTLSIAGTETAPVPASQPSDVHVQVDAPFVFRATDPTPAAVLIPPPAPTLDAQLLPLRFASGPQMIEATALPPPPPPKAKTEHHGFFGSIGRFFAAIFR